MFHSQLSLMGMQLFLIIKKKKFDLIIFPFTQKSLQGAN